jgi:hypothetical protein
MERSDGKNNMPNPPIEGPHVLYDPPEFHQKLLDYGERPYWSPDGKRIAFVESNYGDICEIDIETREVRNLTRDLGDLPFIPTCAFSSQWRLLTHWPKSF